MSGSPAGLFITGTNTGVGKTYITVQLLRLLQEAGVKVGAYKPVCSGSECKNGEEVWPDVEQLAAALADRFPREWICPQFFSAALAPPSAARLEGRTVDEHLLLSGSQRWENEVDVLLVEGVGGWLCPLGDHLSVADLAVRFSWPVLLVVGLELGAINHTLLTVESIHRHNLPLAGIVFNQTRPATDAGLKRETIAEIVRRLPPVHAVEVDYEGALRLPDDSPLRRIETLQRPESGRAAPVRTPNEFRG